jgi:hypothetical protein
MQLTAAHGSPAPDAVYQLSEPDIHQTCSYCGSVSPDTLLAALKTVGTQYSVARWDFNYPHKFYLEIPCKEYRVFLGIEDDEKKFAFRHRRSHVFYFEHFKDATGEQLDEFNRLGGPLVGIKVRRTADGRIAYRAVHHGWQTYGMVGQSLMLNQFDLNGAMARNAPRVPQWFIDEPFEEPKPEPPLVALH